jgi:hypothetical protein
MTTTHRPDNPGPITQTEQQRYPGLAKPEDFEIYCDDNSQTPVSVINQRENDPEAQKRAPKNTGSNYQDAPKRP